MKLPIFQVDAFAAKTFGGNPAAVCPLDSWLPDATMQAVAAENNLSETAFCVANGQGYDLRWFTPVREVELCGHATLAAAHVLFAEREAGANEIQFKTKSGTLAVSRDGDLLVMDFPAVPATPIDPPPDIVDALGAPPSESFAAADYMFVYPAQEDIATLAPDMAGLANIDLRGVIVTAPGEGCDFVSRFFAPGYGIPEDPVTGSAHCMLAPYWSARLNKTHLHARQLSPRGGEIFCKADGERVRIAGSAALYLRGEITI